MAPASKPYSADGGASHDRQRKHVTLLTLHELRALPLHELIALRALFTNTSFVFFYDGGRTRLSKSTQQQYLVRIRNAMAFRQAPRLVELGLNELLRISREELVALHAQLTEPNARFRHDDSTNYWLEPYSPVLLL